MTGIVTMTETCTSVKTYSGEQESSQDRTDNKTVMTVSTIQTVQSVMVGQVNKQNIVNVVMEDFQYLCRHQYRLVIVVLLILEEE